MTKWLGYLGGLTTGLAMVVLGGMTTYGDDKKDEKGFVSLFNGKDLKGWKVFPSGTGEWKVEDATIVGTGAASHLFTERGDFENFHYRIEAKINEGGNSGQYFRTQFGGGFPKGYEAQINSTHKDPVKTGSLYGFGMKTTIKEMLHKPDEWFTQEVIAIGNHITIKVNGKTTVDFVDEKSSFARGHFAIQQHHKGSEIRVRKVEVRELPATRKDK